MCAVSHFNPFLDIRQREGWFVGTRKRDFHPTSEASDPRSRPRSRSWFDLSGRLGRSVPLVSALCSLRPVHTHSLSFCRSLCAFRDIKSEVGRKTLRTVKLGQTRQVNQTFYKNIVDLPARSSFLPRRQSIPLLQSPFCAETSPPVCAPDPPPRRRPTGTIRTATHSSLHPTPLGDVWTETPQTRSCQSSANSWFPHDEIECSPASTGLKGVRRYVPNHTCLTNGLWEQS